MHGSLSTVKHLVLKKIWHNLQHGRNMRAICSVKSAQLLQGSAYVKWLPESHRHREVGWPRAGEEDGGGFKRPRPCHCWGTAHIRCRVGLCMKQVLLVPNKSPFLDFSVIAKPSNLEPTSLYAHNRKAVGFPLQRCKV